jgi:hypothetical protein
MQGRVRIFHPPDPELSFIAAVLDTDNPAALQGMRNPLQANSGDGHINRGRILFEPVAPGVNPGDPHRQMEEQSKLASRAHSFAPEVFTKSRL